MKKVLTAKEQEILRNIWECMGRGNHGSLNLYLSNQVSIQEIKDLREKAPFLTPLLNQLEASMGEITYLKPQPQLMLVEGDPDGSC